MRWVFLTALVLVLGALGAFAIFTFGGYRNDADERDEAGLAAREIGGEICINSVCPWSVEREADGVWKVDLDRGSFGHQCFLVRLDDYDISSFAGAQEIHC